MILLSFLWCLHREAEWFLSTVKRNWVGFTETYSVCDAILLTYTYGTLFYRDLWVCHEVLQSTTGMPHCFTENYSYVTLFNRELQVCHTVLQRTRGMSHCFTENYRYVTLFHRELQLCHAVWQRTTGMSHYVTSWYFSLKCCSSCCRRLLFNWSSSCRSCISFNLALRSGTRKTSWHSQETPQESTSSFLKPVK